MTINVSCYNWCVKDSSASLFIAEWWIHSLTLLDTGDMNSEQLRQELGPQLTYTLLGDTNK